MRRRCNTLQHTATHCNTLQRHLINKTDLMYQTALVTCRCLQHVNHYHNNQDSPLRRETQQKQPHPKSETLFMKLSSQRAVIYTSASRESYIHISASLLCLYIYICTSSIIRICIFICTHLYIYICISSII